MSNVSVGRATLLLAAGTFTVNVLQVIKLLVTSAWFGASVGILDPYFASLRWPLVAQGLIVGALQAAFIPQYIQLRHRDPQGHEGGRFFGSTMAVCLGLFSAVAFGMVLGAPILIKSVGLSFDPARLAEAQRLFYWALATCLLTGLADLLAAFLNANGRFAVPAFVPSLAFMASIGYLVVFLHRGVWALVEGSLLGAILQLSVLATFTLREPGMKGWWRPMSPWNVGLRPSWLMLGPVLLGLLFSYLNTVVDTAVASSMPRGNVTVQEYVSRLHDVTVRLYVVSIASALFPLLSAFVAKGDMTPLRKTLAEAHRVSFLVLIPYWALIHFFGPPLLAALFQRKQFGVQDTFLVATAWSFGALGLLPIAAVHMYSRAFQALRMSRPLWLPGLLGVGVNAALDWWLGHAYGVAGLMMGTGLLHVFLATAYWLYLRRSFRDHEASTVPELSAFWRSGLAVLIGLLTAWGLAILVRPDAGIVAQLTWQSRLSLMTLVALACGAWVVVYAVVLRALGVTEAQRILKFMARGRREVGG